MIAASDYSPLLIELSAEMSVIGQLLDSFRIIGRSVDNLSRICDPSIVVSNENYAKLLADTIKAMQDRLADLRTRREKLAAEMTELDTAISLANEDIETATTIWGRSPFGASAIGETKPLIGMGFTDAIEHVLRTLGIKLLPTEVRDKMQEWGYDFSKYETDVVSSIHTTLKRLETRGKVKPFDEGHRRKSYQWIGKQHERQSLKIGVGNENA